MPYTEDVATTLSLYSILLTTRVQCGVLGVEWEGLPAYVKGKGIFFSQHGRLTVTCN